MLTSGLFWRQHSLWSRVIYGPLPLKIVLYRYVAQVLHLFIHSLIHRVDQRMPPRNNPHVYHAPPRPATSNPSAPLTHHQRPTQTPNESQLAWTYFLHLESLVKEWLAEAESVLLERALPVTYPPSKPQAAPAALSGSED